MTHPTSNNLYIPEGYLSREEHEALLQQKGACVWLTGLSASGKTSIARALQHALAARQVKTYALDGDIVRSGLCKDLPFTDEGRDENIRRVGQVARLFSDAGLVAICAFISPSQEMREEVRALFPPQRFIECHVSCSLEVCEQRDPKNLYARARQGLIKNFTGISSTYTPPSDPELVLRTDLPESTPALCAAQIIALLERHHLIAPESTPS